jgi:hypothetical protein
VEIRKWQKAIKKNSKSLVIGARLVRVFWHLQVVYVSVAFVIILSCLHPPSSV